MKNLEVSKQLPVITTNFEDVKASLELSMEKYKGIVVTEEGLKDCKATQKELSGLRSKIDGYRKTIKKEVLVPVTEFENKCKELEKLIKDVEDPIKKGIEVFDNKRREEKREKALEFISESIKANNLSEKYAKKLTVLDKYLSLSGTLKSIKEDVEQRALILKQEEDREKSMLEIIEGAIKGANETIKTPLKLSDFQNLINMNYPTPKIIEEINKRAAMIREAEKPKVIEQPKEEINKEPVKEPIKEPVKEPTSQPRTDTLNEAPPVIQNEQLYFYDVKIIANYENMKKLTDLLKSDGFKYNVKDQGKM